MRVLGIVSLAAWRKWLADKPLLAAWLGLEVLVEKAKLINEINGKLIAIHMEQVDASLEVLFTSDQSTFAYRRDGGARSAVTGGRRIGLGLMHVLRQSQARQAAQPPGFMVSCLSLTSRLRIPA